MQIVTQNVKHVRDMSVTISHYVCSLTKLFKWTLQRFEGEHICKSYSYLSVVYKFVKATLPCGHYVFLISGIYYSKGKLYLYIKT